MLTNTGDTKLVCTQVLAAHTPAPMWVAVWGATWCRGQSERSLPSFLVKTHNSIFYGNSEIIEVEILKLELENVEIR